MLGVFDSADRREANGIVTLGRAGHPRRRGTRALHRVAVAGRRLRVVRPAVPRQLRGPARRRPAGPRRRRVHRAGRHRRHHASPRRGSRSAPTCSRSPAPTRRPNLDRLVRHQLVHVAVGEHDDDSPVWLSEGVAEWVSVQALAPAPAPVDQPCARCRPSAASPRCPPTTAFNDDDAVVHYALSWWVCEYLAGDLRTRCPLGR